MVTPQQNPKDLSDEELEIRYRALWSEAQPKGGLNVLADLLSTEMTRRNYEGISKSSKRLSLVSLTASFFALLFASISAYFSYTDWKEDKNWQELQISTLREISAGLQSTKSSKDSSSLREEKSPVEVEKLVDPKKTHNKVKNENASKAGTDAQKDARPF